MKLTYVLSATLAAGIVGAVPVSATPLSLAVPPFAFLRYHVDSTQQLGREVAIDSMVQNRFARHFHMAGPAVASFIQNDLVLKPLSAAHPFHIYCVTSRGNEYSYIANLPAGTPIFVRKEDGLPVLNQADGNPLVDNLPPVLNHQSAGSPDLAMYSQPHIDLGTLKTVDNPINPDSTPDIDSFDFGGQDVGAKHTIDGIIFLDNSTNPIVAPFFPFGDLFGAGAAALLIGSHGNSSGGAGPTPNPVPEPAPTAVVAVGAAGIGLLVMRRKGLAKQA